MQRLVDFLREYTTASAGQGPSSTKLVWLTAGLASAYCATLMTVGGVSVYVFLGKADGVYWTAVGALWVNTLGFAAQVLRGQHQVAKDIALGQQVLDEGKP